MRPDPLDGTNWALEYVTIDGVSHMVSGRRIPELAFQDGRVSADDGVNLAEGTYRFEGDTLRLSVEVTTSIPYPADWLPEHDLLSELDRVASAVVHGDFLHLRDGGGNEVVYRYEEEGSPA